MLRYYWYFQHWRLFRTGYSVPASAGAWLFLNQLFEFLGDSLPTSVLSRYGGRRGSCEAEVPECGCEHPGLRCTWRRWVAGGGQAVWECRTWNAAEGGRECGWGPSCLPGEEALEWLVGAHRAVGRSHSSFGRVAGPLAVVEVAGLLLLLSAFSVCDWGPEAPVTERHALFFSPGRSEHVFSRRRSRRI